MHMSGLEKNITNIRGLRFSLCSMVMSLVLKTKQKRVKMAEDALNHPVQLQKNWISQPNISGSNIYA